MNYSYILHKRLLWYIINFVNSMKRLSLILDGRAIRCIGDELEQGMKKQGQS